MSFLVTLIVSYIAFYIVFVAVDKYLFDEKLSDLLGVFKFLLVFVAALLWPLTIVLLIISGAVFYINKTSKKLK